MSIKLSMLGAAVLAASALTVAQAQTAAGSTSGAPKGQLSTPNQDKGSTPRPSVESRAEVKADAAAAKAAASVAQGGQRSTPHQDKKPMGAGTASENTRSAVKAEAAAANKSGTTPKGQESVKDQNKGGVKP